jgi:hypothetical protein
VLPRSRLLSACNYAEVSTHKMLKETLASPRKWDPDADRLGIVAVSA